MKATGIVRRIDELGRVVVPKEIRRTLRIREGDPLEIFTDREGGVILKKYSPIGEMGDYAKQFAEGISKTLGEIALICDRDAVVSVGGTSKKEYLDRAITKEIEEVMSGRKPHTAVKGSKCIPIINDEDNGDEYTAQVIVPIISEGEPIGAAMLVSKESEDLGDAALKICQVIASFIGKQMEQ